MKRRPRRSMPASLVALVLLIASVLVTISAIQVLAGLPPLLGYDSIAAALHGTHWRDTVVAVAAAATGLLGLILLLAAILPGKATVLPLDTSTGTNSGISRRSLHTALRNTARDVDGVHATTLKLTSRTVRASVRTHRTSTAGLADAVHAALEQRLEEVGPAARPTVKVKVIAARSTT